MFRAKLFPRMKRNEKLQMKNAPLLHPLVDASVQTVLPPNIHRSIGQEITVEIKPKIVMGTSVVNYDY